MRFFYLIIKSVKQQTLKFQYAIIHYIQHLILIKKFSRLGMHFFKIFK